MYGFSFVVVHCHNNEFDYLLIPSYVCMHFPKSCKHREALFGYILFKFKHRLKFSSTSFVTYQIVAAIIRNIQC